MEQLGEIVSWIQSVDGLSTTIADGSQQQMRDAAEMHRAIEEIGGVISRNTKAAEEVSASADSMSQQALTLEDTALAMSRQVGAA